MLLSKIPSYYAARRETLAQKHKGAVFLLPSAHEIIRNHDVHFAFRQESHFQYLTGFEEPDSFLVLVPSQKASKSHEMVLFVRKRDADREIWDGERYGLEGAQSIFGADRVYPIGELSSVLPSLLGSSDLIYYRFNKSTEMDALVLEALETARRSQGRSGKGLAQVKDPDTAIGEMRLFKSPEELELMRKACSITALAHTEVMKAVRPGMNEFEVEALIDYSFRKKGCKRLGYNSIVAGGKNSTCLHYTSNNELLKDGDLILIDAGGEFEYYTADITRTFPVGRTFSKAQSALYDLTLKSQKAAIEMVKPGAKLPLIHTRVCEILIDGLLSLGLLQGKAEVILQSGAYKRFYPHNTSHWLGMDVHDVGLYQIDGQPRELEAGMVFTIEPGLYVQTGDLAADANYRGIGIRIEDDILVTANGYENLTAEVVKDRNDIELLRV